jgi:hypothetical protein
VRLCDRQFIPIAVTRRGDPDAGSVIIRLLRGRNENLVLQRQSLFGGSVAWMAVLGGVAVDDAAASAYQAREIDRDRDLWVIEVDDPKGRYWPEKSFEE